MRFSKQRSADSQKLVVRCKTITQRGDVAKVYSEIGRDTIIKTRRARQYIHMQTKTALPHHNAVTQAVNASTNTPKPTFTQVKRISRRRKRSHSAGSPLPR